MDGCRICGGLTRRSSLLCAGCGADLDDYETLDSRTADLLIPVRRYGCAPSVAAPAVQPAARRLRLLALAASAAALGGALTLALLLTG